MGWSILRFTNSARRANKLRLMMRAHAKMSSAMRSIVVANRVILLFAVMLAPALRAQTTAVAEAHPLSAARTLFKQGRFREASSSYRTLIEKIPSPEAYSRSEERRVGKECRSR